MRFSLQAVGSVSISQQEDHCGSSDLGRPPKLLEGRHVLLAAVTWTRTLAGYFPRCQSEDADLTHTAILKGHDELARPVSVKVRF